MNSLALAFLVVAAAAQSADQVSICTPANDLLKAAQEQDRKTIEMVRAYNSLPESSRAPFKPLIDQAYASSMRLKDLESAFTAACGS